MSIQFLVKAEGENKFRFGSFKRELMAWALAQEDGFTKKEFFEALIVLKEENEVQSKMEDKVLCAAWWNEFFNKHKSFVPCDKS